MKREFYEKKRDENFLSLNFPKKFEKRFSGERDKEAPPFLFLVVSRVKRVTEGGLIGLGFF